MRLGNNSTPADDSQANNRSEEVRRRRTARSQQRVSGAAHRITNPVNPRPVIVRGHARQGFPWENEPKKGFSRQVPIVNTPIYSKASGRARRQFYLTMDQYSGTELRLPAIPLVNPGWRLLSGLIAIAMIFGIYSFLNSTYFQVSTVQVKGLQRISEGEVNETLKLSDESVITIDQQAIQDQLLKKYPELLNLQVAVALPNLVTITAAERTPVMAVQKGDTVTWIDAEGVIFPQRGDAGPLLTIHTEDGLPMAPVKVDPAKLAEQATNPQADSTAEAPKDAPATTTVLQERIDPALITAAKGLSEKLPPESTLVYSQQNGMGWTDGQGTRVFIGKDLSNFTTKYDLYQQITGFLSGQGQKAVLISVEHLNAPFYRLEQ